MKGILRCCAPVCLIVGLVSAVPVMAGPKSKLAIATAASQAKAVSQEVRGVVAGAVMVALTERLHDSRVQIRLKTVERTGREGEAENLAGIGEFLLQGEKEWTPFRYVTRYLAADGSATFPSIDIGSSQAAREVVLNDPMLVSELEARVGEQMAKDNSATNVRLQLDRIHSELAAGRFLAITIEARADIDGDTNRRARIEGQYDSQAKRWLGSNYLFDNASTQVAREGF